MFKLFSKYTEYIRRLRSIVKVKKPITEYVVKYYVLGEDQPFCISLFELSERNESYDVTALKRSRDVVKSTISFEFDENLNCTKKIYCIYFSKGETKLMDMIHVSEVEK